MVAWLSVTSTSHSMLSLVRDRVSRGGIAIGRVRPSARLFLLYLSNQVTFDLCFTRATLC